MKRLVIFFCAMTIVLSACSQTGELEAGSSIAEESQAESAVESSEPFEEEPEAEFSRGERSEATDESAPEVVETPIPGIRLTYENFLGEIKKIEITAAKDIEWVKQQIADFPEPFAELPQPYILS